MPGISGSFAINSFEKKFPEWLEWGTDANFSELRVLRGLSVKIGADTGTYYGEWQVVKDKATVYGRAAFDCGDKWIFGYTENGDWAVDSMQIIVQKEQGEFQVIKRIRSRTGGSLFCAK